jgi:hypothetical protein
MAKNLYVFELRANGGPRHLLFSVEPIPLLQNDWILTDTARYKMYFFVGKDEEAYPRSKYPRLRKNRSRRL